MKRLKAHLQISFLFTAILFFTSCKEIEFKDGRVPSEYVAMSKLLTGTYLGHVAKRDGELRLELKSNLAVLSFKNQDGTDIVGKKCGSKIGRLLRGKVNDDKEVEYLVFSFKPGSCDLPANEVRIEFEAKYNKIILSLQDHDYLDRECEWNDRGRNPPTAPVYECRNRIKKQYIRGVFFKKRM